MTARILQVSVGMPADVHFNGKAVTTGIFKQPVSGSVAVSFLNLAGDGQADLSVHGGRNKAIYVYPACHYDAWEKELDVRPLEASQFGENLTVSGLGDESVIIGSRYSIGSVEVTVTQPRLPCFKLGIRMNDETFPSRLLASGRLGFYLRVEKTGELHKGDMIELIHRPEHGISVQRLWEIVFGKHTVPDAASNALGLLSDLDDGWVRRLRLLEQR